MQPDDPIYHGLPHREPFIFIDSVREVSGGGKAICFKTFSGAEPFFRGHFPGDPLVPGVILSEALAQTAGIAAGRVAEGKSYRLSAIKQMKFLRPVRPGDGIQLEALRIAVVGNLLQFQVSATVAGEAVAEGVIVLNAV
jgi:3-hydroxyacyl-[acyl-carrier-protein] dehydratase